jgi:hypothetical protein
VEDNYEFSSILDNIEDDVGELTDEQGMPPPGQDSGVEASGI